MDSADGAWLTPRQILGGLRAALRAERQAIADYRAHAAGAQVSETREAFEALADVEAGHAARLEARLTDLGEPPSGSLSLPQAAGTGLAEWLASDLKGEQWAIGEYARLVSWILDDEATVELMTELLVDEIRHAAWLRSALRSAATGPGGAA